MKNFIMLISLVISCYGFSDTPCSKDRKALCGQIKEGDGRVAQCMKENEAKLSSECKSFIDRTKGKFSMVREACNQDAEKFCPGKKRRDLILCLKSNKSNLSDTCIQSWKELKQNK